MSDIRLPRYTGHPDPIVAEYMRDVNECLARLRGRLGESEQQTSDTIISVAGGDVLYRPLPDDPNWLGSPIVVPSASGTPAGTPSVSKLGRALEFEVAGFAPATFGAPGGGFFWPVRYALPPRFVVRWQGREIDGFANEAYGFGWAFGTSDAQWLVGMGSTRGVRVEDGEMTFTPSQSSAYYGSGSGLVRLELSAQRPETGGNIGPHVEGAVQVHTRTSTDPAQLRGGWFKRPETAAVAGDFWYRGNAWNAGLEGQFFDTLFFMIYGSDEGTAVTARDMAAVIDGFQIERHPLDRALAVT